MEDLGRQAALVVGVLFFMFVGPAIALHFLTRRKRKARALKRAPVTRELLRGAGQTLREELDEASEEVIWDLLLLQVLPLAFLSTFLAQTLVLGFANMLPLAAIYAVGLTGFITYFVRKLLRASAHRDNLRAGFDAELAAGQELDQLMRRGAHVFHDFPAEAFNIDHVVVSLVGVFAIETKGVTKIQDGDARKNATVHYDGTSLRFPTWTTREPLEQAERQATWLARWLSSAVGEPVQVTPILALPGWFVEDATAGRKKVFSGRQLGSLLSASAGASLPSQDVTRVAHQIEQRCRTVAPRYVIADKAR